MTFFYWCFVVVGPLRSFQVEVGLEQNKTKERWIGRTNTNVLETMVNKIPYYPFVECVLLIAGLQPHLASVRLIRLWSGWGCTPVVQSNHGTQDKPAITTHTQERDTVMAECYICSANTILLSPINAYYNQHRPVSCLGGPQQKQLMWRVVRVHCHTVACG